MKRWLFFANSILNNIYICYQSLGFVLDLGEFEGKKNDRGEM